MHPPGKGSHRQSFVIGSALPKRGEALRSIAAFGVPAQDHLPAALAAATEAAAVAHGDSLLEQLTGLRSKAFDGEGVATEARDIIADGVLTTWLLDSRSARQLGLATTGHATRGTSSPPSPSATNLTLAPGDQTPEQMIADIDQGFLITELIGMGVNGITGDYSRGAAGYWIENGEIAYPVSEVTVAGNLKDMFAALVPANDLVLRAGIDAPTIRIDGMTVAGT